MTERLTDEQLSRLRTVAGHFGHLEIRLGGPFGPEIHPLVYRDDIAAILAEHDILHKQLQASELLVEAATTVCNHLEPDGMLRVTDIVTDIRTLRKALENL